MAIEQEWWKDKLAADIYDHLKQKELTLPTYYGQSSDLCMRRHLVDWMSVIVGDLGICATAQHLAAYLLDHCMDTVKIEKGYLHLLALCCLVIAVKFEDHSDQIPQYSRLAPYLPMNPHTGMRTSYMPKQFLEMELNLLQRVDFQLCIPTVAHFLPYYLQVAVDEDDLRDGLPISSKSVVETYLNKHAMYFQEVCLQDHIFRDYHPSLIAAACIAAARICLHLSPAWPKQLELMTDLYLEQLLPCLNILLEKHQQDSITSGLTCTFPIEQSVNYLPLNSAIPSYVPCTDMTGVYMNGSYSISQHVKPVTGYHDLYTANVGSAYVYNASVQGIGSTHMLRGIRGS